MISTENSGATNVASKNDTTITQQQQKENERNIIRILLCRPIIQTQNNSGNVKILENIKNNTSIQPAVMLKKHIFVKKKPTHTPSDNEKRKTHDRNFNRTVTKEHRKGMEVTTSI